VIGWKYFDLGLDKNEVNALEEKAKYEQMVKEQQEQLNSKDKDNQSLKSINQELERRMSEQNGQMKQVRKENKKLLKAN